MNGHEVVSEAQSGRESGWMDSLAARLVRLAAGSAPQFLCARLEEEWLADLLQRHGRLSRLRFAAGCWWAATVISHEHSEPDAPAVESAAGYRSMTAFVPGGAPLFTRRMAMVPPAQAAVMCDINITPLIDVMLVLLITLILTLPIMTHSVRLDIPQAPPQDGVSPPQIINLDIDSDGTLAWNGVALAGLEELEGNLQVAARRVPQPEIRLRADRRARYDDVAKVLASAEHNRMTRMGFVNTAEFSD